MRPNRLPRRVVTGVALLALLAVPVLAGCSGDGHPFQARTNNTQPSLDSGSGGSSSRAEPKKVQPPSGQGSGSKSQSAGSPGASSPSEQRDAAVQLTELLHAIGSNDWATACKHVDDLAVTELQVDHDAPNGDCKLVVAWWMQRTVATVYPSYRSAEVDPSLIDIAGPSARVPAEAITYRPPLINPDSQSLNAVVVTMLNRGGTWKVTTLIG